MQGSHWQVALQVWLPAMPQACVAPGMQAPSFAQVPQSDHTPPVQVRDCMPQFPQGWLDGPAHWPAQASHWQEGLQVWVPPMPQACVAPGMQVPSFMHAPHGDQAPFVQVRDWVPQLPQAWLAGPAHAWSMHAPHWQAAVQVCEPPAPQAWVADGAHAP